MSVKVATRRCPDCGATGLGTAGRPWFSCPACAVAWNPFEETTLRVTTFRPAPERDDAGPRLPFFVMKAREGGERLYWVPAYHCAHEAASEDAATRLDSVGFKDALAPAPLGAALARGPAEAMALLKARAGVAADEASVKLVSLGVAVERDGHVREPRSGWRGAGEFLSPPLLAELDPRT